MNACESDYPAKEARGEDKVPIRLGDGDTGGVDYSRQAALSGGDTVLHVDRCDREVVARPEGNRDGRGAVVRARRAHVTHSLDAVDGLSRGMVTADSTICELAPM